MSESATASMAVIGKGRPRVDGPLKVTGTAQYASDHNFPGMLYAVPVGATIASERGDADAGYAGAPVTIDVRYGITTETHNPIETHATVAVWDGGELTLYETSQGVVNHRNVLADMLGLPREKVRVISKFL